MTDDNRPPDGLDDAVPLSPSAPASPPGPPRNRLSTAALVLGLLSFCSCGCTSLPAIVVGIIALCFPGGTVRSVVGIVTAIAGVIFAVLANGVLLPLVQFAREQASEDRLKRDLLTVNTAVGAFSFKHNDQIVPAGDPRRRTPSWRAALVPFLTPGAKPFAMNEAWDSPTNAALLNPMPAAFRGRDIAAPTETPVRVFIGGLYKPDGTSDFTIGNIPDGTSNTIFAAEAADAVPWPEPRELVLTPGRSPRELLRKRTGTLLLMLDGSVRKLSPTASDRTLMIAINPADGLVLPPDW